MDTTIIDFMRHGQPEGGRRYRGNGVDDPLSDKGWQQMWSAVGDHVPWSRVICSSMVRCSAFGQALADKHDLGFETDSRLIEIGFGRWEGKSRQELITHHKMEFDAFYHDPVHHRPEGAEPLDQFGQRIVNAFDGITAKHKGEHVLVVAHAGVIRAALGYVMQAPATAWYRAEVSNACFTRFISGPHGLVLAFHNRPQLT